MEEYTQANLPGMTVRMEYLVQRIRRNLVSLLGFIQRDLRQSGFQPVAFELRIDDRPGQWSLFCFWARRDLLVWISGSV